MSDDDKNKENLKEGTLISHLLELRDRLMRMVIVLGVVFVPCVYYGNEVLTWLSQPLKKALPPNSKLVSTEVMGVFTTPFTLSFYVALAVVMPYLLYEIWGFVAPGLYKHEKRFAAPLVFSSIVLFYSGMAFSYFLVFPGVFQFLVSITPQGVEMMTDIGKYVSFAMTMFISFGLAFEVPIVVILLVITGMVKLEKLTASRGYVVIGIFVVSAIITPTTDAISQLAMAGPMWILYEGGVIVARMMTRNRPKDEEDKAEQSA
ncbi:MAG TPA: twin-arginine translocase subunit TatC [Rhizomicrobium sp.]|jgi:sec-independent protein translocase protein TatC|nr:twin-arginine translocase subunit TatC [Rhizomicrobium sp.]